ncbi:MAG: FAD-binding oxidoreductase, partial [Clostridia bacterium]|nr:FAD-binding oxidoreductase [Clostridia bacterium]
MRQAYDIVVIGAGLTGMLTAYHLVRLGAGRSGGPQVAVLERTKSPGLGDATRSLGAVVAQSAPPALAEAAARSRAFWAEKAAAERFPLPFQPSGSLVLARDAASLADAEAAAAALRRVGLDVETLDATAVATRYPVLRAGAAAGATFCPADGRLNPYDVIDLCWFTAHRAGVDFVFRCEVQAVDTVGGRVRGLHTSRGYVGAGVVVNAAGLDAGELQALAGRPLPLDRYWITAAAVDAPLRERAAGLPLCIDRDAGVFAVGGRGELILGACGRSGNGRLGRAPSSVAGASLEPPRDGSPEEEWALLVDVLERAAVWFPGADEAGVVWQRGG